MGALWHRSVRDTSHVPGSGQVQSRQQHLDELFAVIVRDTEMDGKWRSSALLRLDRISDDGLRTADGPVGGYL